MYRKCLTLSTSSSISTGAVVNLISNGMNILRILNSHFSMDVLREVLRY